MSEPPRPVFPAAAGIQTPTWVGSVLGDQNRPGFPGSWVPVATATTEGQGQPINHQNHQNHQNQTNHSSRQPPRRPIPHSQFQIPPLTPAHGQPPRHPKPGREGRANPTITKIKRITVQDNPPLPIPHSALRTPNSTFAPSPALDTPRRHRLYSLLVPLRHPRRSIAPFSHPRCLAAFRARRGGRFRDSFQIPARIRPDSFPNLSRGSCVG